MNGCDLANRLLMLQPNFKLVFMARYAAHAMAHHGVFDGKEHLTQKSLALKSLTS
jgi:hypothetical protein